MPPDGVIPHYFDAFLAAIASGEAIVHVHLGHWDDPSGLTSPKARDGFAVAQARLAEHMVDRLDVRGDDRVLDVGCGFGGITRLIQERHPGAWLCGLNIDKRQLEVARPLGPETAWVAADACRLPFADASFERMVCVEAMFHFARRSAFLDEAARVLRPGGRLVLSDIVIRRPRGVDASTLARMERLLVGDLGPWPEIWLEPDDLIRLARSSGLSVVDVTDVTANTLPSYHTIAPWTRTGVSGPTVMRDLQTAGDLRYLYLTLVKP